MLPVSRYVFSYRALDSGYFRAMAGSPWRGAFGAALKRVVCAMHLRECDGCPLLNSCVFPYLFEGRRRAGATAFGNCARVPVPYLFDAVSLAHRHFSAGETITVVLSLIGAADRSIVYVTRAMERAGEKGIGPARARLELVSVQRECGPQSGIAAEGASTWAGGGCEAVSVEIDILTPMRLRIANDLVTPEQFRAGHLIDGAVRRMSSLAAFHADEPIDADYRRVKHAAREAAIAGAELRWFDWTRASSRQRTTMKMGGIVGHVRLDCVAGELLPWLEAAQWVGVGKGASMGLGQFRITAARAA